MTALAWPAEGEIHIRLVTLEQIPCNLFLSPDEVQRADRLLNRQARSRFVAGRNVLRQSLARYLDLDPARLCLATNEHGKPRLSGEHSGSGLFFNLSHSENLAILAITTGCELGVDIELVREGLEFHSMARQFFSPREHSELFSLPPERQRDAFYRCWTRKEAYLKGCGKGFSQPSSCCDVSLIPSQPPALREHRLDPAEPGRWNLVDMDVPPGFCGALAVKGRIHTLTFCDE